MLVPRILTRRRFLTLGAAGGLSGGATGTYTWRIEPHWLEVVHRDLPIAGLPDSLVGQTMVQLSHIHVGPAVDDGFLRGAFKVVVELNPAITVITGDFMTCQRDEELDHCLRVMAHLKPARLATLAIPGNHDYGWGSRFVEVCDRLGRGLHGLGIEMLRNEVRAVAELHVAGLDDLWSPLFSPEVTLSQLVEGEANLVLCHNPDGVDRPGWCGYSGWVLAGHTHGGQCKAPFLRPPMLAVQNKRYVAGEVDLGDGRRLYINRALGHLWRVRFNGRPEITAFRLTRA
jgi:predicted MPP superfamily phosphohydrolase